MMTTVNYDHEFSHRGVSMPWSDPRCDVCGVRKSQHTSPARTEMHSTIPNTSLSKAEDYEATPNPFAVASAAAASLYDVPTTTVTDTSVPIVSDVPDVSVIQDSHVHTGLDSPAIPDTNTVSDVGISAPSSVPDATATPTPTPDTSSTSFDSSSTSF